jgi:hypothetical protein
MNLRFTRDDKEVNLPITLSSPNRCNLGSLLMQRLVTSSTAAIRTTLEKRQALLNEPQPQASLSDSTEMDEWAELDGQSQVDIAVQTSSWAQEKAEVDLLLTLARETNQHARTRRNPRCRRTTGVTC